MLVPPGLTHAAGLQEHPDGGRRGGSEDQPHDPVATGEEQKRQEQEDGPDQGRSAQDARPLIRSASDAHGAILRIT